MDKSYPQANTLIQNLYDKALEAKEQIIKEAKNSELIRARLHNETQIRSKLQLAFNAVLTKMQQSDKLIDEYQTAFDLSTKVQNDLQRGLSLIQQNLTKQQ